MTVKFNRVYTIPGVRVYVRDEVADLQPNEARSLIGYGIASPVYTKPADKAERAVPTKRTKETR